MRSLISIATVLLAVTSLTAAEPDFYLLMNRCSSTVGYTILSDDSLKTIDGTPVTNACSRSGKIITCELTFDDGSKNAKATYTIRVDSPPTLVFSDDTAADWFMVDTSNHAAVMITRIVDKQFAGAKVCQGLFATQSELETLNQRKR